MKNGKGDDPETSGKTVCFQWRGMTSGRAKVNCRELKKSRSRWRRYLDGILSFRNGEDY